MINRFVDFIECSSGGSYTVCACDSSVAAPGASDFCRTKDQFKINAGKLHVSGVSCLIEQDRFQRGVCVGQTSGGHRCYSTAADVPLLDPPLLEGRLLNYLLRPEDPDDSTVTPSSTISSWYVHNFWIHVWFNTNHHQIIVEIRKWLYEALHCFQRYVFIQGVYMAPRNRQQPTPYAEAPSDWFDQFIDMVPLFFILLIINN